MERHGKRKGSRPTPKPQAEFWPTAHGCTYRLRVHLVGRLTARTRSCSYTPDEHADGTAGHCWQSGQTQ